LEAPELEITYREKLEGLVKTSSAALEKNGKSGRNWKAWQRLEKLVIIYREKLESLVKDGNPGKNLQGKIDSSGKILQGKNVSSGNKWKLWCEFTEETGSAGNRWMRW